MEELLKSPLSPRQKLIWSLLSRGLSVSQVAERLKTTFQYINQTKRTAEAKLSSALMSVAEASNLQIKKMRLEEGVLWGYHPGLDKEAIVTYTTKQGIKVWFWNDNPEELTDERFLNETRLYLFNLAEERRIDLTEEEKQQHPGRLANVIFSRLIPEVTT